MNLAENKMFADYYLLKYYIIPIGCLPISNNEGLSIVIVKCLLHLLLSKLVLRGNVWLFQVFILIWDCVSTYQSLTFRWLSFICVMTAGGKDVHVGWIDIISRVVPPLLPQPGVLEGPLLLFPLWVFWLVILTLDTSDRSLALFSS